MQPNAVPAIFSAGSATTCRTGTLEPSRTVMRLPSKQECFQMVRTSLAVAAATLLTAAPVSAAPVSGGTPLILPSSAHVQLADWNVRHHRWVYNPRTYGPRFAYRH